MDSILLTYTEQDRADAERLAGQLREHLPDLEIRDGGLPAPGPGEEGDPLTGAVADADAVVCAVGRDTSTDGTLDAVLRSAVELERPLLGVLLHSNPAVDLPPVPLTGPEATIVNWDMDQIVPFVRNDGKLDLPNPGVRPQSRPHATRASDSR